MSDSVADSVKRQPIPRRISLPDSFEAVNQSLKEAQANAGEVIERYYTIAGQTIRLRFAGPAMLPAVTRALEHALVEPTPHPNLTINVWDSASTRSRIPDIAWFKSYGTQPGVILSFREGSHCIAYQSNTSVLSLFDIAEKTGYYWTDDLKKIPYFEVARPMSVLLHWWFHHQGYLVVHGGAIGIDGKGIVLAGKGGSGKSTTALLWLEAGYQYVGDDLCVVGGSPGLHAHSLYNSAMLFEDDLRLLPSLKPFVAEPLGTTDEKRMIFLNDKERLVKNLRLKAILLPRVTQHHNAILTATSSSDAMKSLAPSTLMQLPGAQASSFQAMASLVKRIPCYRLELGTDRHHVIDVIREFLTSLDH